MTSAELDLDYGPEPAIEEPEREIVSIRRTPLPIRGRNSTPEEWARIREVLIAHRASKGRNPDGTPMERFRYESDEPDILILESAALMPPAEAPSAAAAIAKRCIGAGWQAIVYRSSTRHAPVLFQADSEEGAENPHQAGDVRYPGEDRRHYALEARLANAERKAAMLRMTYQSRPKSDGKVATEFLSGRVWDPVNGYMTVFPASIIGEFSPIANLDSIITLAEFNDWLDILIPRPKKKVRDHRTKDQKRDDALLGGDGWNG